MVQRAATVAFQGVDAVPVDVQVQVAPGLPAFHVVGLADKAVSEARERVRVANIDAPELPGSPKCQDRRVSYAWCDYRAGEAARVALVRLVSRGRVMITRLGTDPYGRTLATISVNGVDAGDYLIAQGLAKPWR